MRSILTLIVTLSFFASHGQQIQNGQNDSPAIDTLRAVTVPLPNVSVSAHQQIVTLTSKGERYTGGYDIEPGRQVAVYYANPDTMKSHMVKGISVLIERKFTYGRLRINLRSSEHGGPEGKDILSTSYFILPESANRHHTWLTFTLPDGIKLSKEGVFIIIEGMTASDEEKYAGITMFIKKAVTSDGSSRVTPSLRIQDSTGKERLIELAECPKLVSSVVTEGSNSNTWVKISPNPRFSFKRNSPTSLGSRTPVAYNATTQLTLVSW